MCEVLEVAQTSPGNPSDAPLPADWPQAPGYDVQRELGRGGMGVVYLAYNRLMARQEVLKVVNPAVLERAGGKARFLREIQSAAQLHHPNVVTAYSALQVGDLLVFAMQYIEGEDLQKLVQARGPLPVVNSCYYTQQAALGLQHAFEKNMVHRDIKPQNLILSREGKKHIVKVLDFGLAKVMREKEQDGGLTVTGEILGTPAYSAPEQMLDAAHADIRADIYSLGCTLYFLLAGKAPFKSGDLLALFYAHQSIEPEPVHLVRPEVPEALSAVVKKMMAKDTAERYQKPIEVVQALAPFVKPGVKEAAAKPSQAERHTMQATTLERPIKLEGGSAKERVKREVTAEETSSPDVWQTLTKKESASAGTRKGTAAQKRRSLARKRATKKKWMLGAGVATCLLLLGLVGLWASGVFVKTKNGTIELKNLPADAEVQVDGEEAKVTWGSGKSAEITVKPGTHQIVAKVNGIEVIGQEITIKEGGREVLKATLVSQPPPISKPPAIPTTPPTPVANTSLPREITNTLGMKLVLIPPGKFLMGSLDDDKEAGYDEKPQHEVEITKAFYLGKYEVTRGQFRQFVEQNGYTTDAEKDGLGGQGYDALTNLIKQPRYDSENRPLQGSGTTYSWRDPGFAQTDDHPVLNVSWNDAKAFCDWLSKKEGSNYRLPTEAQWEYSCRAGTQTRYSSGNDPKELAKVGNVADGTAKKKFDGWNAITAEDGYVFTAPVGQFQPNAFGLCDMHGNVWEWCEDWHDQNYYRYSPAQDPTGQAAGSRRVFRGGCFDISYRFCRAACRGKGSPIFRGFVGIRVVLVPPDKADAPKLTKP